MDFEVIVSLIGAGSAIAGAIIGGFGSYWATKAIKDKEWDRSVLKDEIRVRRELYSAFMKEISRLELTSHTAKISDPSEFSELGNFVAQVELVATDSVLGAARKLADHAFSAHRAAKQQESDDYPNIRREYILAVKLEIDRLKST